MNMDYIYLIFTLFKFPFLYTPIDLKQKVIKQSIVFVFNNNSIKDCYNQFLYSTKQRQNMELIKRDGIISA